MLTRLIISVFWWNLRLPLETENKKDFFTNENNQMVPFLNLQVFFRQPIYLKETIRGEASGY